MAMDERKLNSPPQSSKNPWDKTWHQIRGRCSKTYQERTGKYRGMKSTITPLQLKEIWFRDKAYSMKNPTIDRINNGSFYTYKNCQYLERDENSRKDKIGSKNPQYGKKPWNYGLHPMGHKHTIESRKKISLKITEYHKRQRSLKCKIA